MPLTTCKKCNRICSTSDKACPYCGAALSQQTDGTSDKQGHFKVAILGFFMGFFLLFALVFTLLQNQAKNAPVEIDSSQNCLNSTCMDGIRAVTYSMEQEPYYTCKSGELSDYANYVLSISLAQDQIAGIPQKVSSKTGEPELRGKEKALLEKYRSNAGVSTFEEAISKCYKGIGKMSVIVLYNPAQGDSLYVSSEKNREDKFWIPKSKLYKLPTN